jgi:hypothetical protein
MPLRCGRRRKVTPAVLKPSGQWDIQPHEADVSMTRILVLDGGFGGVYTGLHLVSRENFFLLTPMPHEMASCDLDVTRICAHQCRDEEYGHL